MTVFEEIIEKIPKDNIVATLTIKEYNDLHKKTPLSVYFLYPKMKG
jgi:hypothetical protein